MAILKTGLEKWLSMNVTSIRMFCPRRWLCRLGRSRRRSSSDNECRLWNLQMIYDVVIRGAVALGYSTEYGLTTYAGEILRSSWNSTFALSPTLQIFRWQPSESCSPRVFPIQPGPGSGVLCIGGISFGSWSWQPFFPLETTQFQVSILSST